MLCQPLLAVWQRRGWSIDILAIPRVAAVFRHIPGKDNITIHVADFQSGKMQIGLRWQWARLLRQQKYTQAIVLPISWKTALLPFWAGIPIRTGYVGEWRYGLINNWYHQEDHKKQREQMVLRYLRLGYPAEGEHSLSYILQQKQLGDTTEISHTLPHPVLKTTPSEVNTSLSRFALSPQRPLVALCPGAEYGIAKRWPPEYFAQLATALWEIGYQPVILGSPNEQYLGESITYLSQGHSINLSGKTKLEEAILLLAGSALVVSNDSGLMHIAAALNVPVVSIFGSSSPRHTPPLSLRSKIVSLDLWCSPCYKKKCRFGHTRCLRDIHVEQVFTQCKSLISSLPALPS